jgi:glycosyltransferase involved in cell wall biosynthesis
MCKTLSELGHPTSVSANFGLHGATLEWRGVKIYPRYRAGLGQDVITLHAQDFLADAVISLYDIWVLDNDFKLPLPWIGMVPVDGAPVSRQMRAVSRNIDYRIAYSRFGEREMKRAGIDCFYVPHGFDAEKFTPGDKWEARDNLEIPYERFVVSTVAANKGYPCRKGWPELLEAYAIFNRRHPDAVLYLHTTNMPFGSAGEGINIKKYLEFLGVPNSAWMMISEKDIAMGVPDEHLIEFYRASDVFLLPSMGEGFGMPVAEAQLCGCPVIVQNCSATAELCVNGIAVEPLQHMWLPQLEYYWQIPSIPRIVSALEAVYNQEPSVAYWEQKREEGVREMRERYAWPVVKRYWDAALCDIERSLW